MDDAYLYPRDSMSSEATMRMSVNSLDSTTAAAGRGQIHANLAFVSTPEHEIISPLSLKDSRPNYVKSPPPPPPPKDKPPKLGSAVPAGPHRSAASWHPGAHQSRQSSVDDLPPAPSPPQHHRSLGVFQSSLTANADEVKGPSVTEVRNSAPAPKALNGQAAIVGGVQLRTKPSVGKADREKSHLYEELPWAEREGAAAAAAAMAAAAPGSGAKERRRANPLYGERSSTDPLPPKPDSNTSMSQPDVTLAMTRRLQQHCCIFSGLIGALAVVAIAALIIAILASTGTLQGGTQGSASNPNSTGELLQRLSLLQTQVMDLKAIVDQQEIALNSYAVKLNSTSSAFDRCKLREADAVKLPFTDSVSDTASSVIVGAYCNRGTLQATASKNVANATFNSYRCQCFNSTVGCELLSWSCPTSLF